MQIKDIYNATLTEAGGVFGVHRTSVMRWCKKQGAPMNADGSVNIPALIEWKVDADNLIPESCESPEAQQALTDYRTERAKIEQIKRLRLEQKLIPLEKIEEAWTRRVALVTSGLEALRFRLPGVLQGKSKSEMNAIIKAEVRALRLAYAEDGKYTPSKRVLSILEPCLNKLSDLFDDGEPGRDELKN
jgi:hypothetical protein